MANTENGQFVWYDLLTKNPEAAIAFYGEVNGWKTQPFAEDSRYRMWVGKQGPLGGVMELPAEPAKMGSLPHWMGHVQVADVDRTVALTTKLGGSVLKDAEVIPTVGRFAVVSDPQGASLSVFQPNAEMGRHDPAKEGEFCWNELMTSDADAAFDFYREVFGWKSHQELDMGAMGTYRIYGLGDTPLGGIMNTPKAAPMPPMWIYYTQTMHLEASIKRASGKGAKVLMGPEEVPGGGRIAQFTDPQGVVFALHEPPKQ